MPSKKCWPHWQRFDIVCAHTRLPIARWFSMLLFLLIIKQKKELKDGYNYGFYMAPYQGRAGKFLDDSRLLREYSLQGPVATLDVCFHQLLFCLAFWTWIWLAFLYLKFKHKKRVYKFIKINQKEIKALNTKVCCGLSLFSYGLTVIKNLLCFFLC